MRRVSQDAAVAKPPTSTEVDRVGVLNTPRAIGSIVFLLRYLNSREKIQKRKEAKHIHIYASWCPDETVSDQHTELLDAQKNIGSQWIKCFLFLKSTVVLLCR